MSDTKKHPISHPTWDDIKPMLKSGIGCMKNMGMDLSNYEQVKALAHKIYYYVGYKIMPKHQEKWSDDWLATYNNWLIDGIPKDEAHRAQIVANGKSAIQQTGNRIRKDIAALSDEEIKKLKKAFKGLMERDPKNQADYKPDKKCYFSLAAKHWFPAPTYCQHHMYGFLSWHRWQILDFENALRSVKGCEDVVLPYWNIESGEFPELFNEAPFNSYTFPINVYPDYYEAQTKIGKPGTVIERNSDFAVYKPRGRFPSPTKMKQTINNCINNARTAPSFSSYNGINTKYDYDGSDHLIKAHDWGHTACGYTMANQDIAAFDPIFWFFHCNWDRLWWEWQVARDATTLEDFQKKVIDSGINDQKWLLDPQMSISDPFGKSNADSINLAKLGIHYDAPTPIPEKALEEIASAASAMVAHGSSWRDTNDGQSTNSIFTLSKQNVDRVSLRVKGINRINIAGSFFVTLSLGGEEAGHHAFFQSTFSGNCENCVEQSRVSFDFIFDRSHLVDADGEPKEIKVEVTNLLTGEVMPFDKIGNPSINIRMIHC